MVIVTVDDGERVRAYKMSVAGYARLLEKAENFGAEIQGYEENQIPIVDENEVLNDFGSLGL